MAINFGGLATGLDTNALITELMKAERRPIERLERDKQFFKSRLDAFKSFEQKLKDLQAKFEALDTSNEVRTFKASAATDSYFSLKADSKAVPGSFQVEVKNLAQVQKDVSQGYASKTEASFGTGTITINGKDIAYSGDSLSGLADKINAANTGATPTGVSASIINDGVSGYRLVLSGKDAGSPFSISMTETTAGTYAPPAFANTQVAKEAAILVDNVEIKSKSNVFEEAIPGVTLTLNKPNDPGVGTVVSVETDKTGLKDKIQGFVNAFNGVVNFLAEQKDADWGKDSAFRSAKRRLQDLLVTSVEGTGSLGTLSQLGIVTDKKTGTLSFKSSELETLIGEKLGDIDKLLAGESGIDGIAKKFTEYLKGVTDASDGIYAGRKETTDKSLRKIDDSILRLEARLEQREKNLRAQFTALEGLVSSMNSTSSYLSQQMSMMNSMWSQRK